MVTPLRDSHPPLGTDAPGRSRCVPKATGLWLLQEPWEVAAASTRAPVLQLPKSPREPRSPFQPSRGEAPADPADIPALPGRKELRGHPRLLLSAPSPLPLGQGNPTNPPIPYGVSTPLIPNPQKQPGSLAETVPPFPPPLPSGGSGLFACFM